MSSDGYFDDDDDLDVSAYEQLDAIEAAFLDPPKQACDTHLSVVQNSSKPTTSLSRNDSVYDLTFDIDVDELQKLDGAIADAYQGRPQPVAGFSRPIRTGSKDMVQTTLFGGTLPSQPSTSKDRPQLQKTKSTPRKIFGQKSRKTKQWDKTEFAKSGLKRSKSKGKGKANENEDGCDDEQVEFEQFPAPFVSVGPPPPMKLIPDLLEAKHWIYPLNKPKRDYQYNIVRHCLFDNTIVALPTGLGKTFIAGVVMLNYYRWFPEGKVVFVAPTKPLVAQQIEACHKTCGIPGSDAIELTGQVPKTLRNRYWQTKRIFYMTPQTLLNDLTTDNCDPLDIILLVVDEAHRATGGYAYNQVIRYLMAKNPHFRLLALTATPGNNPDAVQDLVDGLHISHIEIRDENSLDIKAYIHHKKIEQHIIPMSESINKIKTLLATFMDAFMKRLKSSKILGPWDHAASMHPFRPQAVARELSPQQQWARGSLTKLSTLARAMAYLIEGTVGMCYNYLKDVAEQEDSPEQSERKGKKLRDDPMFQAVLTELEIQRNKGTNRGFPFHPKMERLKGIIIHHFGEKLDDESESSSETRVMVFVTFREAVDEIVEALNMEQPLIRAHKFIGQGTDKRGKKGLLQVEQQKIIKQFQAGEFNVLVATSIGEEGLDIGEVDLIACYDAQKTPIRMLQRSGRTGRKRAGVVHVLLAEAREEQNLERAKVTYKEVQKSILRGEDLELYDDVERLLPDNIKPECLEKVMEIQEYVREDPRKKQSSKENRSPKGVKRKRNNDVERNIPDGASRGFVSVADLIQKGTSKKKKTEPASRDFDVAGEDDDTEKEIESGVILAPLRRTQSTSGSKRSSQVKGKLKKAATIGGIPTDKGKQKQKKTVVKEPTSSQFSRQGVDDSDDADIERGYVATPLIPTDKDSRNPIKPKSPTPPIRDQIDTQSVMDLSDSDDGRHSISQDHQDSPVPNRHEEAANDVKRDERDMAWLVEDDDEPNIEILSSSPVPHEAALQSEELEVEQFDPIKLPPHPVTTEMDESVVFLGTNDKPSNKGRSLSSTVPTPAHLQFDADADESVRILENPKENPSRSINFVLSSSPMREVTDADPSFDTQPGRGSPHSSPKNDLEPPEPTFPVRRLMGNRKRITKDIPDSPSFDMPPPSQPRRRIYRHLESTPQHKRPRLTKTKSRKKQKIEKPTILGQDVNPFFDGAATHSGEEVSEGESLGEGEESDSDRMFLRDSPMTQMSQSYDQSFVYRQSLLSQAPIGKVPTFARSPVRPRMFGLPRERGGRLPLTSSPSPEPDEDMDGYVVGSFVVEDDDVDVSYVAGSSEL